MEIERGADGYYHPEREDQIQELVRLAKRTKVGLRVRGSAHSVAKAIYTDGYDGTGAPPNGAVEVMMDRFRTISPIEPVPGDPDHATVEVLGGCNLGKNPYDPTHTSTWQNSLNYYLQQNGWALDDLGGISHQTVAGFLSTGSSGGSVKYSIDDDILEIHLVDGNGELLHLKRDDPDPKKQDLFFAAGVSMGLFGVITKVKFLVRRSYNLVGNQITSSTDAAAIDFFGPGTATKPSLEKFLFDTEYTRLMWWPQHGFERMQVWQASRVAPAPDFKPIPYLELGRSPELASLAGSLFYTILGNLDHIADVPAKLTDWYAHLEGAIEGAPDADACSAPTPEKTHVHTYTKADVLAHFRERLTQSLAQNAALSEAAEHTKSLLGSIEHKFEGPIHDVIAKVITKLVEMLLDGALSTWLAQVLAGFLKKEMPTWIRYILGPFVSDGTVDWQDTWMCGLPMDNQMDDQLWPTWFTELWIPIEKTEQAMQVLKTYYDGGGDAEKAFAATEAYSCELYSAKKSPFWMSPSYGADVFRIDVFWFALNAGDPATSFYPKFWALLKDLGFRPHWGKILPMGGDWPAYYRAQLPRLDEFLALRAKLDPDQIFVTDYWRTALAIAKV